DCCILISRDSSPGALAQAATRLPPVLLLFQALPRPPEINTPSLHDALPIYADIRGERAGRLQGDRHHARGAQLRPLPAVRRAHRSEEHTSELQSRENLVCRLLLEKKDFDDSPASTPRPARPRRHAPHDPPEL